MCGLLLRLSSFAVMHLLWGCSELHAYVPKICFEIIGISVRVIPRPGQQLLGINGRDDGPVVSILFSVQD